LKGKTSAKEAEEGRERHTKQKFGTKTKVGTETVTKEKRLKERQVTRQGRAGQVRLTPWRPRPKGNPPGCDVIAS